MDEITIAEMTEAADACLAEMFEEGRNRMQAAESAHKEFRAKARDLAEVVVSYFGKSSTYWSTVAIAKEIIAETEKESEN